MSDPERPKYDSPASLEDLEDVYSADYLTEVAEGDARAERLEELKRRIAVGTYNVDADTVARELLSRGDLDSD